MSALALALALAFAGAMLALPASAQSQPLVLEVRGTDQARHPMMESRESLGTITPGQSRSFPLTVHNPTSAAQDFIVEQLEPSPPGVVHVYTSPGCTALNAGLGTWALLCPPIPAGGTRPVTLHVNADATWSGAELLGSLVVRTVTHPVTGPASDRYCFDLTAATQ